MNWMYEYIPLLKVFLPLLLVVLLLLLAGLRIDGGVFGERIHQAEALRTQTALRRRGRLRGGCEGTGEGVGRVGRGRWRAEGSGGRQGREETRSTPQPRVALQNFVGCCQKGENVQVYEANAYAADNL